MKKSELRKMIREVFTGLMMESLEDAKLPSNTQELVNAGKVTYRGMGFGKEGTKLKVNGKEYIISDEKFEELGGIKKIRFDAPYRRG